MMRWSWWGGLDDEVELLVMWGWWEGLDDEVELMGGA